MLSSGIPRGLLFVASDVLHHLLEHPLVLIAAYVSREGAAQHPRDFLLGNFEFLHTDTQIRPPFRKSSILGSSSEARKESISHIQPLQINRCVLLREP